MNSPELICCLAQISPELHISIFLLLFYLSHLSVFYFLLYSTCIAFKYPTSLYVIGYLCLSVILKD